MCILNVIKASPNRTRDSATLPSPGTCRYPCLLSILLITPHTICFTSNKALLFALHKVKDYTTFLLFSWCVWITVSFLQKWTKNRIFQTRFTANAQTVCSAFTEHSIIHVWIMPQLLQLLSCTKSVTASFQSCSVKMVKVLAHAKLMLWRLPGHCYAGV